MFVSPPRLSQFAPLLLLAIAAAASLGGCARPFPEDRVPRMKILVMDFELPAGMKENPAEIVGWGPTAATIYQNPRAGAMIAERLSARLARFSFINLFSRTDLRYYFARKRQLLKTAYPNLDDAGTQALIDKTPPLDFARELSADKVVSGRITANHLSASRTFNWWSSTLDVQVEVTDVISGRIEWQKRYTVRKRLASQYTVQEIAAKRIAGDLKEQYFRPLAK